MSDVGGIVDTESNGQNYVNTRDGVHGDAPEVNHANHINLLNMYKILQESPVIHSASPQSRLAVNFAIFRKFVTDRHSDSQLYGRTDNLCENSEHNRPGLWSALWIKPVYENKNTCK